MMAPSSEISRMLLMIGGNSRRTCASNALLWLASAGFGDTPTLNPVSRFSRLPI